LKKGAGLPKVAVKEVMSSPVITVKRGEVAMKVAKLMVDNKIGSVVVVDEGKNPIGIITERDVVKSLASGGFKPEETKAEDIMSQPLRTISPDLGVEEAAKLMRRLGVKRLPIMEEGKLIGIVSSGDIVRVTPSIIEVLLERSMISSATPEPKSVSVAGYCDSCGSWSDGLKLSEGQYLCEDCSSDLGEGPP
jgi:CBS domain-containing protein